VGLKGVTLSGRYAATAPLCGSTGAQYPDLLASNMTAGAAGLGPVVEPLPLISGDRIRCPLVEAAGAPAEGRPR